MELARDVEANLVIQGGGRITQGTGNQATRSGNPIRSGITGWSGSSSAASRGSITQNSRLGDKPSTIKASETVQQSQPPFRPRFTCLTAQELAELKAKGLCFCCRKPYSPGHECPLKQLRVMIAEEDEQMDLRHYEFYQPTGLEEMGTEPTEGEGADGDLPMYALAGIMTVRTMHLYGITGGLTVTVLIDSGASHNFISTSLVGALQL